ncbi:MAG: hypothetical protein JOZ38_00545 [Candidatus Eremiobacteraeota bacterium]|nr:hypothetical protein [Candidatus Eremiobacteraeota bacterium]
MDTPVIAPVTKDATLALTAATSPPQASSAPNSSAPANDPVDVYTSTIPQPPPAPPPFTLVTAAYQAELFTGQSLAYSAFQMRQFDTLLTTLANLTGPISTFSLAA